MELRQLKYFIKAAELLNFTEAANSLYITQSTLSQQIKQLEDELCIPLFDRVGKRVRLTEAGTLFLPYARQTVQDAEDGRSILKDLMNLHTGTICIGLTYGLTHLLTQAIVDFNERCPTIKLKIEFGTTDELLEKLEQVKLDMMLSFLPAQPSAVFVTDPLFTAVLSLVVHKKHPLAAKKSINLRQLREIPLLLPAKSYSIRNFLDSTLSREKITPDVRMEVNDINMLLQLVSTGKWSTILMNSSLFKYPDLQAIPISGPGMSRQATITWPANAYRKKAASVLAECLLKQAAQQEINGVSTYTG